MPIVKLYANLRKLAGTKEVSVTGATVRAVLSELVKQNPPLDGIFLKDDGLRPHIVITLNGQTMVDLNVEINEQDIIAIFPPSAGG